MAVGDSGFHIADAFVEIHADKDPLERELRDLPNTSGPAAEAGGKGVGKRVGKGIGDGADGKGVGKRIGDDVDGALGPRATRSGGDSGNKLSKGMQLAIVRNSPLIAAAVGAALAFGAPAALAGAGLLFGGIAIVSAAQSQTVKAAWQGTWQNISETLKAQSGPMQDELTHLAGLVEKRFGDMQQGITDAMSASVPLVDRLTNSVLNMADNAMPGLVHAVQNAGPAVDGLGKLLESTGTGLGGFFDQISQHSPAAGVAFAALGNILQTILPLLGSMLGQGAELASIVLPPLARILDVVAGALEHIAPILPLIAIGFGAWKIVNTVTGWLDLLSAKLQTVAADGGRFSTAVAGTAASGVSKMTAGVGALIGVLTIVGGLWSSTSRQIDDWSQGLLAGGAAAAKVNDELQNTTRSIADAHSLGDAWNIVKGAFADSQAKLEGYNSAQDKAAKGARDLLAAMDPVQRAQTLQQQALNDLNYALEKHGEGSASAESAERKYADASQHTADVEAKTELAIHGVTQAMLDQADQARAGIDSLFAMQHAQEQQRQAESDLAQAIRDHGAASVEANDSMNHYAEAIYNTASATAQYKADQSGLKKDSEEYKAFLDSQLLVSLQEISTTLSGPTKDAVDRFITQLQNAGVTTDGVSGKLDDLGNKNPQPTVGPVKDNITPQVDALGNELFDLGKAHPVPTADLNIDPAQKSSDAMVQMMWALGLKTPTPTAYLETHPFENSLAQALSGTYNLAGMHPTPTAGLNTGPLQTQTSFALGQLYNLGSQNPTATAWTRDNSTPVLNSISAYLRSLEGRTVTTYVNTIGRNVMGAGGILSPLANGDRIHAFASGGFETMSAKRAAIVPPRSLRMIGDRTDVDEAFVPIDRSTRSLSILAETAMRMGKAVVDASGGTHLPNGSTVTQSAAGRDSVSQSIGELHLHIDGTGIDLTKMSTSDIRRLAQKIDTALAELRRSRS